MNTPTQPFPGQRPEDAPHDPDLAEQAVPGHGVPSHDPSVAAQEGLSAEEAQREAKSAYAGGGAVAGLAAGAAVGAAIGGPVGVVVGGTAGVIAGALGGEAAGQARESDKTPTPGRLPTEAEIRSADDGVDRS